MSSDGIPPMPPPSAIPPHPPPPSGVVPLPTSLNPVVLIPIQPAREAPGFFDAFGPLQVFIVLLLSLTAVVVGIITYKWMRDAYKGKHRQNMVEIGRGDDDEATILGEDDDRWVEEQGEALIDSPTSSVSSFSSVGLHAVSVDTSQPTSGLVLPVTLSQLGFDEDDSLSVACSSVTVLPYGVYNAPARSVPYRIDATQDGYAVPSRIPMSTMSEVSEDDV